MTFMTKLKYCPFCGSEAEYYLMNTEEFVLLSCSNENCPGSDADGYMIKPLKLGKITPKTDTQN